MHFCVIFVVVKHPLSTFALLTVLFVGEGPDPRAIDEQSLLKTTATRGAFVLLIIVTGIS